jgi:hypothetical protein
VQAIKRLSGSETLGFAKYGSTAPRQRQSQALVLIGRNDRIRWGLAPFEIVKMPMVMSMHMPLAAGARHESNCN